MRTPLAGSILWYIVGILAAACPWPIFFDREETPVFYTVPGPPPSPITVFWNNFPDATLKTVWLLVLITLFTTPIFYFLRVFFRCQTGSLIHIFSLSCLAGLISGSLCFYLTDISGHNVRSVFTDQAYSPTIWQSFIELIQSGGIWVVPLISTVLSYIPFLLFSPFSRVRKESDLS